MSINQTRFYNHPGSECSLTRSVVGFVGIGNMGKRMAANILRAGYQVVVWSRTPSHARELESLGALLASSPKELAERSSMVITMLAGPQAVREIYSGKNGLIEGLQSGEIFIDMTTNLPSLSRALAKELRMKGAEFLDAPVSGSIKPAADGTLLILVGGRKETLEKARPILQTMGDRIVHLGDNGAAASMKLVLQMHSATIMLSFAESLTFGAMMGLDPSMILDILNKSVMKTYASESKGGKVINSDYSVQHALKSMAENLDLVAESVDEAQLTMPPCLTITRDLYHAAVSNGKGELDFSAIATEVEELMRKKTPRNRGQT